MSEIIQKIKQAAQCSTEEAIAHDRAINKKARQAYDLIIALTAQELQSGEPWAYTRVSLNGYLAATIRSMMVLARSSGAEDPARVIREIVEQQIEFYEEEK